MNKFISILLLFLWVGNLSAQGWERTYVGQEATEIIEANDGGYIVMQDELTRKIDAAGHTVWTTNYAGEDIIRTSDDAYAIVAGLSTTTLAWIKIDNQGNFLDSVHYVRPIQYSVFDLEETEDGGFMFSAIAFDFSEELKPIYMIRIDQEGNELWEIDTGFKWGWLPVGNLTKTTGGNFVFHGLVGITDTSYSSTLVEMDADGNILWSQAFSDEFVIGEGAFPIGKKIITTSDNGFLLNMHYSYPFDTILLNSFGLDVYKFNADGELLWRSEAVDVSINLTTFPVVQSAKYAGNGIVEMPDGSICTQSSRYNHDFGFMDYAITKLDAVGNTLWSKVIGVPTTERHVNAMMLDDAGYILLCGWKTGSTFVVKVDGEGNVYTNVIQGKIAIDEIEDCAVQEGEQGLDDWMIKASGVDDYYAFTDTAGHYTMGVDTGNYTVTVIPPSDYWQPCIADVPVVMPAFNDTVTIDVPVEILYECPYMEIDLSTPFLRRCFENTYVVRYCNQGTIDAENVYIEIDFDESLTINNAEVPYVMDGNTAVFNIGNVAQGDCDAFLVKLDLDCGNTVLGQTHCSEARIFPDSLCSPVSILWSGASLNLDAVCEGEEVRFSIENVGTGGMEEAVQYIVIEDDIIMMEGDVPPLDVNESFTPFIADANGATYRLEVEQIAGHPQNGNPSVAIEGCVGDGTMDFSLGFITQYSEYDGTPFVSIDCQENIGAYDPNDKKAYPKGYGAEQYIEANTDIEYHIRFQNTGTDTAFHVFIIDTLSGFLNVETITRGASSHPYQFSIAENNILKFDFENIMLPDSNVNEAASHGFVKFRIQQQADNPSGASIHNSAAIYFDSNPPVITNLASHTIGEDFVIVYSPDIVAPGITVHVFPNPMRESAAFNLSETIQGDIQLNVYDFAGHLVDARKYNSSNFIWQSNNLMAGMYSYTIVNQEMVIAIGKLMIQ